MASLTGNTIQSTYDSLLKVTDNDSITGSLKRITDGLGNNTPLYLSSSAVEIVSTLNVTSTITASNLSGTNTGDETKSSIETKLGAATSSNSGYLTSTDWSTFNNKIAGTGTLNTIPKFTSSSSIGNSSISDNGTIVTINEDVNVSGGNLAIGTTTFIGRSSLSINRNITGNASSFGIINQSQIQSDVTSFGAYNVTTASTQATTFTLTNLSHYYAEQGTLGAGSTVSTQMAFQAHSSLIGATTNIGFRGQIPSGTNRWNIYMDGTANNYLAGNLGIGSVSLTQYNLRLERSITGNATSFSFYNAGIVQSDVTTTANYNATYTNTQAASFTLAGMNHYNAIQGVFGAGSAVTTQSAFRADSSLIGATNNYGFRGLIPSGTGRWNLYMDGTASNYLAGPLGIGTTSIGQSAIAINYGLTGATTSILIAANTSIASNVTGRATIYFTQPSTSAATFTLGVLEHYRAQQGTFGAGSTVTEQRGFYVASNLTGAGINKAFSSDLAASATNWNLHISGTANNYLAGALAIGSTTVNANRSLNIGGSDTNGLRISSNTSPNTYYTELINYNNAAKSFEITNGGISILRSTLQGDTSITLGVDNSALIEISRANGYIRFNSATTERARINTATGSVGIGTTTLTGYSLAIGKTITGAGTSIGVYQNGVVQSDVTASAFGFRNDLSTQAATFTLPVYTHYAANQSTIGAGTTLTTQIGFSAGTFTTGANVFGFRGQVAAASGRYNLYMDGTANNYLAGNLGIGTTNITAKLTIDTVAGFGVDIFRSDVAANYGAIRFRNTTNTSTFGSLGFDSGGLRLDGDAGTMYFSTSGSERMRINGSGNVGIGTTSPSQRFQVGNGTSTGSQYARFVHSASDIYIGQSGGTIFGFSAGTSGFILSDNASFAFGIGTTGAQPLVFGTNNNERVRINSSGRLLVGKTADDVTGATVQVSGNISFTNSFNTQISNYTLVLGDQCRIIQTDNASANTVTVPTDASVNFPVGTEIAVIQYGTGQTTIVASSGVTIRSRNSYTKIADRYTGVTLVKLGVNDWYLIGNLTA